MIACGELKFPCRDNRLVNLTVDHEMSETKNVHKIPVLWFNSLIKIAHFSKNFDCVTLINVTRYKFSKKNILYSDSENSG